MKNFLYIYLLLATTPIFAQVKVGSISGTTSRYETANSATGETGVTVQLATKADTLYVTTTLMGSSSATYRWVVRALYFLISDTKATRSTWR